MKQKQRNKSSKFLEVLNIQEDEKLIFTLNHKHKRQKNKII